MINIGKKELQFTSKAYSLQPKKISQSLENELNCTILYISKDESDYYTGEVNGEDSNARIYLVKLYPNTPAHIHYTKIKTEKIGSFLTYHSTRCSTT